MSKEVAAAILTQAYFQSSSKAAESLKGQIDGGGTQGRAPELGATSLLVSTYRQILEAIGKLDTQ